MDTRRFAACAVTGVVLVGAFGWLGGSRLKSPAQVAAETAAPAASLITVRVQKVTLSADVITRGTVGHRAAVKVNLAASAVKLPAGGVVTLAPAKGAQLDEGSLALAVGGRPVLVLSGTVPGFRDLSLGAAGDDVRQLETALVRLGFDPGLVDGVYDAATGAAVAAWYTKSGWEPFGPTEQQRLALSTTAETAAKASAARLQADLAVAQAQRQLDIDERDARTALATALAKARSATATAVSSRPAIDVALAVSDRDRALADADVAAKAAALRAAQAAGQADAVAVASAELTAGKAAQVASAATATAAVQRARDDLAAAEREVAAAAADATVAQAAVDRAAARTASPPADVTLLLEAADLAAHDEAAATQALAALQAHTGVQVPADEVIFLDGLPRRIDDVQVKRGDQVGAALMTVSGLALSIDASLSVNDAKLVPIGARVSIEEPDLGITATGVVSVRADQAGTNGVDPQRFYVEVTPDNAPASLVGASVKLTIPVRSTAGLVLAVPLSALTVGASGSSRLEVVTATATRFVDVTPGLVAQGLVEVTARAGELTEGDNVVVGRGSEQLVLPNAARTTNPPASSTPAPGATNTTTTAPGTTGKA